jgi:hypothetical protein
VRGRKGKRGKRGRRKRVRWRPKGGAGQSVARARVAPAGGLAGPQLGRKKKVG